jgi:hypothetical protein
MSPYEVDVLLDVDLVQYWLGTDLAGINGNKPTVDPDVTLG